MANSDSLRVLVIDDSREVRSFLIDYILKPNNFEIDVAVDGAHGLEKALSNPPDLIVMDYEMPHLTGLEVLRALRQKAVEIPVILMTSHGSEQIAVEFFRLGVSDYIIKPFHPQEMLDAIDNALSVTRLKRERDQLTRRLMQTNHQLEQRLQELNVLYQIGKFITALMEPDKTLERIVDAMLFMTGGDEGTLVLVDSDTGKLKKHVRKQQVASNKYRSQRHIATKPLQPPEDIQPLLDLSTNRLMSVPLKVGDKVMGTLTVSKDPTKKFSPHDERLLQMLADYAAIAIHNLNLMHQLHLTKEREKRQIRGLFEKYVAPTIVKQLLARPDLVQLGGFRRPITVLFADLRGFSTFSTNTSPEVLVELLNRYMQVAADAILIQEGTLDKFMGDAVMAFFNAPLPQSGHPMRAIQAAWSLCRSVEQLHQQLPESHRFLFGVGVGVGEALVGNVGTPRLMNYTVMGDTVNKVKRLQENAQGGQILISQETYDLVYDKVEVERVGDMLLKGQSQPEPVFEVRQLLKD